MYCTPPLSYNLTKSGKSWQMAVQRVLLAAITFSSLFFPSVAQTSCSQTLVPTRSIQPVVASGYQVALVATGLAKPRSIHFDTEGNLLVVEADTGGISALTLNDQGGICLSVSSKATVLDNLEVCCNTSQLKAGPS